MKKLTPREITKLEVEAENIQAALADTKKLYDRLDEITHILGNQKLTRFVIVDNFAEKNTVFRTTSVKRFELKAIVGGKRKIPSTKTKDGVFSIRKTS